MARQEAYVLVQRNAMKAIEGKGAFRENLEGDSDVASRLSSDEIARVFDLEHALRHAEEIVARARA
jgi:adenylosuccinate lyase